MILDHILNIHTGKRDKLKMVVITTSIIFATDLTLFNLHIQGHGQIHENSNGVAVLMNYLFLYRITDDEPEKHSS